MFILALVLVLLFFVALVTEPESWPQKFASFLREHKHS
jgi:hypothetical protein